MGFWCLALLKMSSKIFPDCLHELELLPNWEGFYIDDCHDSRIAWK